jgi:hypothetical protein
MGKIKAVEDSEMKCNVVEHVVVMDLMVTWHNAGLGWVGKEVVGCYVYKRKYTSLYTQKSVVELGA